MKKAILAIAIVLAFPAIARAGLVTMVEQQVPLGPRSLASAAAPMRFNMLGIHWRGSGTVEYRTQSTTGRWSGWTVSIDDAEPDPRTGEGGGRWHNGDVNWAGPSRRAEFRTAGAVAGLRAYYLWSKVTAMTPRRRAVLLAGSPTIVPRSGWLADEKILKLKPHYAPALKLAVIHHTAGSNSYTPAQAAAIVRGIEVYHVQGNGWNDIGYNFLVDRFGTVYEGRAGGTTRNVIGAHALGFNNGTVGVALIGNFMAATPPPQMQAALVNLLAWRLDVAHIDPLSTVAVKSGGNFLFKRGKLVHLRAISGHRDTGPSECPGNAAYALLPGIANRVSVTGLPKLYAPAVTGSLGARLRFQARLSSAMPWTVTVTGAGGATVATGHGTTAEVSWTWDSAKAGAGPFAWSIDAGSSVLPASGTLGSAIVTASPATAPPAAAPPPAFTGPVLSGIAASPAVLSPNPDGTGAYVNVDFALAAAAAVTVQATAAPPAPTAPVTLLSASLPPGDNSFSFSLASLPDGNYQLVVRARPKGGYATIQSAEVTVDRTLSGFAASPTLFSPNADGVNDTTTFGFALSAAATVQVVVQRGGTTVTTVFSGPLAPGAQSVVWDGTAAGVKLPDGVYSAVVLVTDTLGFLSFAIPVTIDTTPPVLTLLDPATLRFQLNEPATVTVTANGQVVVRPEAAGVFTIPWQGGVVTTLTAQADDAAGNLGATLTYP